MEVVLLTYYCVAIVAASVAGGLLPRVVRMTHRRTEIVVSFVAGVMLGVAMLHLLPHAIASASNELGAIQGVVRWALLGFLAMFFIERFFCFHHHDAEDDDQTQHACGHTHSHSAHQPTLSWTGAAMGLTLHSLLAGVALAASVRHAPIYSPWPGLGAFLAIALHKPLDAMTIAVLMGQGRWSTWTQSLVNGLFALAVPLGVACYMLGVAPMGAAEEAPGIAAGVAFSAGVFLCVAMSDLLPELQFHDHDRLALSVALLAGLGVAEIARQAETHQHALPATLPAPAVQPVN